GQGSQWVGMAAGLLEASPVFAERMGECARALEPFVDWDLFEVVGDEEALGRVDVVQPVLWAVMVSLASVWRSWGVEPSVVVGHSQGEIAAACVAGGLSLEDGARVVALRSRLIRRVAGGGGMVSVALGADRVRGLVGRWPGVGVAAVNGPSSTVVSGDVDGLEGLLGWCEEQGIRARRVPVDYASHSAHIDVLRDELVDVLGGVKPRSGEVPLVSTVTGRVVDTARMGAGYWFENLRGEVLLEPVVRGLVAEGVGVFVEVSAHPVLAGALEETLDAVADEAGASGASGVVVGSLRRDEGGLDRMLVSAGELWVRGVPVDW
ncbi:acyltransferase domain-containing protein, partial [Nocardiopsis listeri]|uniref:acyltransferase domain-containing protein n=1 Tax=Nocardiopsis listeri TaxID=53440 RepID=UPI000AC50F79